MAVAKAYTDTANTFLQANTGSALAVAKAYTDTANTSLKLYSDANTGSALAAAKVYTDTANTSLKLYSDANTGSALAAAKVYTDTANTSLRLYAEANTGAALAASKVYTNANVASLTIAVNAANTNAANASYITTGTLAAARLPVSGVTATIYGGTTQIPVITVDTYGRITSAANAAVSTTISLSGSSGTGSVSGGGTLTVTSSNTTIANVTAAGSTFTFNPQTSGVTVGTYGGAATIPVIKVDSYGRVTVASNATPSGTYGISISGNAATATNVAYSGLTGVVPTWNQNTTGTASNITAYTINQSVGTTSNVQHYSIGVGTAADSANTGSIRATNNITAYYSDERLKTNLGNIENALEKVLSLNGFYYEANKTAQDLGYSVKREVGLSAQEVQRVLPEIVVPAPIDEKYLTIHYDRVVPLLVEAIKELQAEIELLKRK